MGCARAGKHLPSSGAAIWGRTTPMSCSRALRAPKRRTRGHRRRFKTRPDQQKRDCALLQRGRRGVWVPYRPVSAQNPRARGVFAILAPLPEKRQKTAARAHGRATPSSTCSRSSGWIAPCAASANARARKSARTYLSWVYASKLRAPRRISCGNACYFCGQDRGAHGADSGADPRAVMMKPREKGRRKGWAKWFLRLSLLLQHLLTRPSHVQIGRGASVHLARPELCPQKPCVGHAWVSRPARKKAENEPPRVALGPGPARNIADATRPSSRQLHVHVSR